MSYQVLARKWRPQRFDEVVGQKGVTQTLRNAIATGRIAQAFVFAGARGGGRPVPTTPKGIAPETLELVREVLGAAGDATVVRGAATPACSPLPRPRLLERPGLASAAPSAFLPPGT